MMCHMGSAKDIALLLISMGIGYMVCAKADDKKGFVKQLGYWIGSIIVVLSILAALSGLYFSVCNKMLGKYMPSKAYPMMHEKGMHAR